MMRSVLFVNSKKAQCSIWDSGQMAYQALRLSDQYRLDYVEVDASSRAIPCGYDVYVFNYHPVTMWWMDPRSLRALKGRKLTIVLETLPNDPYPMCPRHLFDGYLALDPTLQHADKNVFAFPRPLEPFVPAATYVDAGVPVIGTFGFATRGKGFERVVEAVNSEFDRAVVRINIPHGTYVARSEAYSQELAAACRARAKRGVEVRVTHDYMSKQQLVDWCASNTLNCFLYDRNMPGLAATTDQAILAARPLSVSRNDTFRHVLKYIRPYPEWSLRDAIECSIDGVSQMKADWAPLRFAKRFEEVLGMTPSPPVNAPASGSFYLKPRSLATRVRGVLDDRWKKTVSKLAAYRRDAVMASTRRQLAREVSAQPVSYALGGEDLCVDALFRALGIHAISYLDVDLVGNAGDNTLYFYEKGCTGVCVDGVPACHEKRRRCRSNDVCVPAAIGVEGADEKPAVVLGDLVLRYGVPDYLSVELGEKTSAIVCAFDFTRFPVRCVRVGVADERKSSMAAESRAQLIEWMQKRGYFVYADTRRSLVFVSAGWYRDHQQKSVCGTRGAS
jgi:hypothetical protein